MGEAMLWRGRVTHPRPEALIPHALGGGDSDVARHVEDCSTCRAEVARLREAAGALRASVSLERLAESADCLDEVAIADFVAGRLRPETRGPVVTHLLDCARCRSVVLATGRLLAEEGLPAEAHRRRWRRWSLPLGLAAAAALVLLLVPRRGDDGLMPGLRDSTLTTAGAPVPLAPRGAVARVDRVIWSSVPRVERYRMRLYNGEGAVLWTVETADTLLAVPDSVVLSPRIMYFWKVEAQTEWQRWAASDLAEFRLEGSR